MSMCSASAPKTLAPTLLATLLSLTAAGCGEQRANVHESLVTTSSALSCSSVDPAHSKKRLICHANGNGGFNLLSVAAQGCNNGHSNHGDDFDLPPGATDCNAPRCTTAFSCSNDRAVTASCSCNDPGSFRGIVTEVVCGEVDSFTATVERPCDPCACAALCRQYCGAASTFISGPWADGAICQPFIVGDRPDGSGQCQRASQCNCVDAR